MYDFTAVGEKEVRQVLSQRRDFLRQELRRLDDTLGFYGEKSVERGVSKEMPLVAASTPKQRPTQGPSEAILAAVQAHPGQPLRVIVNGALDKGVRTKAKDAKHMLRNTVDVLLKAGRIVRLDGKLYPKETVESAVSV